MRVHKYINDPKELLEQGKQIVSENADNKFVHRVSMVNLMLSGLSSKLLAEFCGDSERTLQTWLKKVDEIGWEALVAVKQAGRPNKLNDEQINEIKAALKTDPAESGYNVWDGPALSDYIKTKYGIDYGVRACQILMHKMGFSLIRPQTYPSLGNPDNETREALKKTDRNQSGSASYYRISGRSTFSGADIYYKDLGRKGFRAKSHVQTRKKESFIQWFHYSRIGRTRCNQVILV